MYFSLVRMLRTVLWLQTALPPGVGSFRSVSSFAMAWQDVYKRQAFMPLDQLIASFGEFIPFIKTKLDVVLFNAFPFNLLKGIGISIVTMLLYKRLTPILKGRQN